MRKIVVILLFAISSAAVTGDAIARRILVGPNLGADLLQACLLEDDARDVQTTNGNYVGCCSKKAGYCVLCEKSGTGNCYKFTNMMSFQQFMLRQAPSGGAVIQEDPQKPESPILRPKAKPDGGQIAK